MDHIRTSPYDALVVTADIDGFYRKNIMVDTGKSNNFSFLYVFENIGHIKKEFKKFNIPPDQVCKMWNLPNRRNHLPMIIGQECI